MSLIYEQAAFLKDVRRLLEFAESQSLMATGGELERKPETQALALRTGGDGTMDSMHLRKCAIDLYFFQEKDGRPEWVHGADRLEAIGARWEALDPRNRWGGRITGAPDITHFERNLGAWPSSAASTLEPPAQPAEVIAVATAERPGAVTAPPGSESSILLKRGASNRDQVIALQKKLIKLGLLTDASGNFDGATEAAVVKFQQQQSLVTDGVVGTKTWSVLNTATLEDKPAANDRWLGEQDLQNAAARLQVDLPALWAVYKVESSGKGFVGNDPKILFEGHVFWRRLQAYGIDPQPLAATNPDILYPKWTRAFYGDPAREQDRLRRAETIHEAAARESASWGLFQIMGYHWQTLNRATQPPKYASVNDFVACMARHEREQLEAFCYFIQVSESHGKPLVEFLRALDWAGFAYGYNDSGYRQNAYDDKLRAAYLKYGAGGR